MAYQKYPRQVRLRNLRGVLGITQAELGKLCGYSESYILAAEIGQRKLSLPLAKKVSTKTGVGLSWLLGMEGDDAQPILETGKQLRPEKFHQRKQSLLGATHQPTADEESDIHQLCIELSQLMLAVCRKGQLATGKYFFREMVSTIESELRLKSRVDPHSDEDAEQMNALQEYLFAYESDAPVYTGRFEREEREDFWQLFSPSAARQWARLFVSGTDDERCEFRQRLREMAALVNQSYSVTPKDSQRSS
jgi:transcriptional regulator with XRE-family HTH domain